MQNRCNCDCSFFLFLLVAVFGWTGRGYFQIFVQLLLLARMIRIGVINMMYRGFSRMAVEARAYRIFLLSKLKSWYLHYRKPYSHQGCHYSHKITWKLDHVILRGYVTNPPIESHDRFIWWFNKITWQTKSIISTTSVPITTTLGRMVTYHDKFLAINSNDHLITWSCEITK